MKIDASRAEGFVRRPDPAIRAVLVYGPDRGLVAERAERLARTVVDDLKDPFRVADLAAAALARDPARLADEVDAQSLMGGRRVVRVRNAGNDVAKLFGELIDRSVSDTLVIVDAGELTRRSDLVAAFEQGETSAAIACYGDDPDRVADLIRDALTERGLSADPAALDFLARHLGRDRLVTRAEIEKLALYMGDETRVREADAAASVGDSAPITLDSLGVAVAGGDHRAAAQALRLLQMDGVPPLSQLRAVMKYFQRLHLVAGRIARGQRPEQAVAAVKPPVHFRIKPAVLRQAGVWSVAMAADALERLFDAENACKETGAPDKLIAAAALLRLTEGARRIAQRRKLQ